MTLVLVTGGGRQAEAVTTALTSAGCRCVRAVDLDGLRSAVADLGDERVDTYLQLPVTIEAVATTAIGRIRELLTQGLIARFDAAEVALGAVRDGGSVVLVGGNNPGEREMTDDQRARFSLLRVLSHTILADHGGREVRSTVLPGESDPADVVAAVVGQPTKRQQAIAEFVERDSDLSYADWRLDLLSMANES